MLPPPHALEVHDPQAAEKWKRFRRAWENYTLATGLNDKSEEVQVATLLTVIGEEAREVFSTFSGWEHEGDNKKIGPVLAKFELYCEPRKNIPFQRYRFNRRCQEPGESYDQYRTALRKLSESCDFESITPDEILRDRLMFGIRDGKTRERLLREPALTLKRTNEICHAAESMTSQLKIVEDSQGTNVSAVSHGADFSTSHPSTPKTTRDCRNLAGGMESRNVSCVQRLGRSATNVRNQTTLPSSVEVVLGHRGYGQLTRESHQVQRVWKRLSHCSCQCTVWTTRTS